MLESYPELWEIYEAVIRANHAATILKTEEDARRLVEGYRKMMEEEK